MARTSLSDDPDTAVAQTIAQMAAYARVDSNSPMVRSLAAQLRGRTTSQTITHVWNWIRARVRFVPDRVLAAPIADSVNVAEVLIRPIDMLRMPDAQGDCDDFSMLGASIFLAAGVPVCFCTIAADPSAPAQFSHVYLLVNGAGFDSSHGPHVGWEAQNRFGRKQFWSVENGMPIHTQRSSSGLGDAFNLQRSLGRLGDDDGVYITQLPGGGAVDSEGNLYNVPAANTPSTGINYGNLLTSVIGNTFAILKARLAVPPPGTVIQTAQGTIATGVTPGGFSLSPSGAFGTIPSVVWIGGLGLLGVVLLKSLGGRK